MSARRSEWPSITADAPVSAIISAEISLVCARPARMAQSCAPTPTRDPSATTAKVDVGRRRDEQVDLGPQRGIIARRDTAEFGNGGLQAIHLPVAGYQRSTP